MIKEKTLNILYSIYNRIVKTKGTVHSISLAVALGLFIGCIIPMGLQSIIVIPLAILLRISKMLSFIFTWVTNPYTITFIYPIFILTGSKIMSIKTNVNQEINFSASEIFSKLFSTSTWTDFSSVKNDIIIPFFLGAIILGAIIGILGYLITYFLVYNYRKNKL